ncbi:MAG TPA: SURF1 family protein [Oxalicibacterium sp.]|nr:SURF1 family protein [Oxalicibacterium sp.]
MTRTEERERNAVLNETETRPRSRTARLLLLACAVFAFAGFFALGTWQLYRLQWKLALIERVDQRVHAAPVAAPPPAQWPQVTAASDEYRHVRVTGVFLHSLSTRVQAVTELGGGYWLLTPLRTADGVVLVNRGFVPPDAPVDRAAPDSPTVTVTGLLRISEPKGGFLRDNDPAHDRWYSRDVQAIAQARGLSQVAPYFVDADAKQQTPAEPGGVQPVGGLTVISFHNNHLVYALTWYALALMVAGALVWILREERRLRREARRPD